MHPITLSEVITSMIQQRDSITEESAKELETKILALGITKENISALVSVVVFQDNEITEYKKLLARRDNEIYQLKHSEG